MTAAERHLGEHEVDVILLDLGSARRTRAGSDTARARRGAPRPPGGIDRLGRQRGAGRAGVAGRRARLSHQRRNRDARIGCCGRCAMLSSARSWKRRFLWKRSAPKVTLNCIGDGESLSTDDLRARSPFSIAWQKQSPAGRHKKRRAGRSPKCSGSGMRSRTHTSRETPVPGLADRRSGCAGPHRAACRQTASSSAATVSRFQSKIPVAADPRPGRAGHRGRSSFSAT